MPTAFSASKFWPHGRYAWRHLVLGRARRSIRFCSAGPMPTARRVRRLALHPFVQRGAGAGRVRSNGESIRRAGARSLRHDRGGPSDGLEPAARRPPASPAPSASGPASRSSSSTSRARSCRPASREKFPSAARTSCTAIATIPRRTPTSFRDGYFRTGDQGVLDAQGYLTLTGRLKELINRGGEKISPLEVDAVLLAHPAVAEAVSFAAPGREIRRRGPAASRAQGGCVGRRDPGVLPRSIGRFQSSEGDSHRQGVAANGDG